MHINKFPRFALTVVRRFIRYFANTTNTHMHALNGPHFANNILEQGLDCLLQHGYVAFLNLTLSFLRDSASFVKQKLYHTDLAPSLGSQSFICFTSFSSSPTQILECHSYLLCFSHYSAHTNICHPKANQVSRNRSETPNSGEQKTSKNRNSRQHHGT